MKPAAFTPSSASVHFWCCAFRSRRIGAAIGSRHLSTLFTVTRRSGGETQPGFTTSFEEFYITVADLLLAGQQFINPVKPALRQ